MDELSQAGGWSRRLRVAAAVLGAVMAGGVAFAASSWIVGLNSPAPAQGHSAGVANLTITASTAGAINNLLYPGGTGDVVISIDNPNPFPVTITAVSLPASTAYATGYSDSALSSPQSGCDASASAVSWSYAGNANPHSLASPLTVAARAGTTDGTLVVTFTNAATMGSGAPTACQNTWFKMPSLTGITASADTRSPTTSPATDSWSS